MRVLLADDDQATRLLLESRLTDWGYETVLAKDGLEAWSVLQQETPPPLALLDWMMPGLDGLELCRRLGNREEDSAVYVILLTARNKAGDLTTALEAGANEFITKPVNLPELKSRLASGRRLVQYKQALKQRNQELAKYASQMESLAEARARQLVYADRLSMLGTLSAGMAHEINNPATLIAGNAQTLTLFWEEIIEPILKKAVVEQAEGTVRIRFVLEEMKKMLQGILSGVQRIASIVKALRMYARQDKGERIPCDMNQCVSTALDLARSTLKTRAQVELNLAPALSPILGNVQQIEQVLINLFVNAADAMERSPKKTLTISTEQQESYVVVTVADTGPGIPPANLDKIWTPFFSTKTPGKGTGLGLPISQGIVTDHGGRIRVENRPEGGAAFMTEWPIQTAQ